MAKNNKKITLGSGFAEMFNPSNATDNQQNEEKQANESVEKRTSLHMDKDIHRQFKAYCVKTDATITGVINDIMDKYISTEHSIPSVKLDSVDLAKRSTVTYYTTSKKLKEINLIATNNDTSIRELLTYRIMQLK